MDEAMLLKETGSEQEEVSLRLFIRHGYSAFGLHPAERRFLLERHLVAGQVGRLKAERSSQ